MIWREEQLGVHNFTENDGNSTIAIPLRADLTVKAETIWVAGYGEYSGAAEIPCFIEVLGCDGYAGPVTTGGWEFAGPGLGFILGNLPLDPPDGLTISTATMEAHGGTFSGQWPFALGKLIGGVGSWSKYPRLALRFSASTNEDYPSPGNVWASAKVLYGWNG
jgi:hypothetical protein